MKAISRKSASHEAVSVQFTEIMRGFISHDAAEDTYQQGYEQGKAAGNNILFRLTIKVSDIDEFITDPEQPGSADGYIESPLFGGSCDVEVGYFNLFVDVGKPDENVKHMKYRLMFTTQSGEKKTLVGFKNVRDNGLLDIWHDTSTLYTRILEGHIEESQDQQANNDDIFATGILHILPKDFAWQMTTFKSDGGSRLDRASAMAKFFEIFAGTLWSIYGPHASRSEPDIWKSRVIPTLTLEGIKDAEITNHSFNTDDGLGLSLFRFLRKPGDDVVLLLHGLTTSTDMFIMPEHNNLVNYLHDNGYGDVISCDWRGSMRFSYNDSPNSYNLDDIALYDIPKAIEQVRKLVGENKRIHVISHCVGSLAFNMSLYSGLIKGVSSAISNSVALTPRVRPFAKLKISFMPTLIDWVFRYPNLNPNFKTLPGPGLPQGRFLGRLVDLVHHECDVSACHMLSAMWGAGKPAIWEHKNLMEVTHRRCGDLFGAAPISYYRHIRKMLFQGVAVKAQPTNPEYNDLPNHYLDHAKSVNTPVLYMTGDMNKVFTDSNVVMYNTINRLNPDNKSELKILKGYGHQDPFMGRFSYRDVFPEIVNFIAKHSNA